MKQKELTNVIVNFNTLMEISGDLAVLKSYLSLLTTNDDPAVTGFLIGRALATASNTYEKVALQITTAPLL